VEPIFAFIIAGGKSSRMGQDKAFLVLEGKTLIDHAIAQAKSIAEEVFIVGPAATFSAYGRIVKDIFPGCGPLGGIHAALRRSRSEYSLVLPLDMPLVTPEFLRFMLQKALTTQATVTVPRAHDGYQPLCAIYRSSFAELAEAALKQNRCRIDALFPADSTCIIGAEEMQQNGFDPRMFDNLNSPEDYERVAAMRSQSARSSKN
jgi:molybdopterin-guanine dinucleotide biosynthesis protein A